MKMSPAVVLHFVLARNGNDTRVPHALNCCDESNSGGSEVAELLLHDKVTGKDFGARVKSSTTSFCVEARLITFKSVKPTAGIEMQA